MKINEKVKFNTSHFNEKRGKKNTYLKILINFH